MSISQGMKFSKFDKDQDAYPTSSYNSAVNHNGGFWFDDCAYANVNSLYGSRGTTGSFNYVTWYDFREWDALKWVEIKFRPNY